MKVKILFLLLFFGLNQLEAQNKAKPKALNKPMWFLKQPKGFVYVPQKGESPAFYVMEEPVTIKEFNEFLQKLYNENNIMDVNTCKLATPNDHYKPTKYLILSDPSPIKLYAKYLSEKFSDSTHIVYCFPVSEKMWKQMKGPEKIDPLSTEDRKNKNPYGIYFFNETEEFKINSKGEFIKFSDKKGYQRGTFRIALSQIVITKENKK